MISSNKKEKILDMIKTLGYTDESYEFMEKHIDDRYLDSYIKNVFKDSENGRLYFDIPDSHKERIDQGWSTFKEMFSDFCERYNVTYQNFIENRISINKNDFKLKKAITQFEIERMERNTRLNSILHGENIYCGSASSNVPKEYENSDDVIGTSIVSYGNPPSTLFLLTGTGRRTPSLLNHSSVSFRDGKNDVDRYIAVSSSYFEETENRFFDTLIIGYNVTDNSYGFYINHSKSGKTEYKRLIKNRSLNELELRDVFENQREFRPSFIQNIGGALRLWFLKNNKLFFSAISVNNADKTLSIGTPTETNMFVASKTFDISINKDGLYKLSTTAQGVLSSIFSKDGINFDSDKPVKEEIPFSGNFSFCDSFFTLSVDGKGVSFGYTSEQVEKISENDKKRIENDVTKKLDEVGSLALPKEGKIKLVLSINIEDWLLCSTGEKWTSCLNFESKFHAAHYHGLPGLLGDPNRIMIYFTDGTKKTYNGLESEKIITRSWVLLDSKDIFNLIKFYPIEIIDADKITDITGINFKDIDRGFITKNPIKLLEYKYRHEDGYTFSGYIYQDKTSFVANAVNDIHLKFTGEKGYYSLFRELKTEKIYMVKAFTFSYEDGYEKLKESHSGSKLTDFSVPVMFKMAICSICGGVAEMPMRLKNGKTYFEYEGKPVCHNCVTKHFRKCMICDKLETKGSSNIKSYPYGTLCNDCNEEYSKKKIETKNCCHCGDIFVDGDNKGAFFYEENGDITEIIDSKAASKDYFRRHALCPTCQSKGRKRAYIPCSSCGSLAEDSSSAKKWGWYISPVRALCPTCREKSLRDEDEVVQIKMPVSINDQLYEYGHHVQGDAPCENKPKTALFKMAYRKELVEEQRVGIGEYIPMFNDNLNNADHEDEEQGNKIYPTPALEEILKKIKSAGLVEKKKEPEKKIMTKTLFVDGDDDDDYDHFLENDGEYEPF